MEITVTAQHWPTTATVEHEMIATEMGEERYRDRGR
jgi:hypothetical protein